MAQAFITTHKDTFRWNCQPRVGPIRQDDLSKLEPEGDIWKLDPNKEIEEELRNLPKIKETIEKLYLKRMKTTYQLSHCDNLLKAAKHIKTTLSLPNASASQAKIENVKDEDFENELLEYCNNLYGPNNQKIIPPLYTSRNVFGYLRPSRLRTTRSVYQDDHGKVAYRILMSAYDRRTIDKSSQLC
ncbi:uncharacterized protein LOC115886348 [Sitophilus oryzae]|uniref:Uncharacterized protein LOC115886348 n=1 Tax=Sitophilus oryzae TaxID=7048 RepID=A0A6J2YD28_SITOR|nr:uncharacterized protein LOC115886348 [Sitophilus oryzae]